MANLEKVRSNYVSICVVLLLLGATSDYLASSIDPAFRAISFIDDKGQVIQKQVLSFPVSYSVLRIVGGVFYTLAISIFVSVFVTDRIESELDRKREHELEKLREAINIDVFDTLFKRIIPEEIFAVIKSSVIQGRTVTRDAEWIYEFSLAEQDIIDLRQTISFELHNISSEEIIEPTRAVYSTFADTTQYLQSAHCEIDKKAIVIYNRDNPKNSIGISFNEGDEKGKIFIDYDVKIPPYKYAYFTMVFHSSYKHSVQDEYFSKSALINGTLRANYPPGYEFKVYAEMSSKLRLMLDEPTRKVYKLEGAILPRQGYVFYLYKKDSEASPKAT